MGVNVGALVGVQEDTEVGVKVGNVLGECEIVPRKDGSNVCKLVGSAVGTIVGEVGIFVGSMVGEDG